MPVKQVRGHVVFIEGDRTAETTGVSCYLGQTTEPVFSLELEL